MCTSVQKHTAYQSWWLSFGEHISNLACISLHIFISVHITFYRLTLSIIIFIMLKLLDERKYISYMTFVFISCVFLAVAPLFVCVRVCVLYLVFSVWHFIFIVDRLCDFIRVKELPTIVVNAMRCSAFCSLALLYRIHVWNVTMNKLWALFVSLFMQYQSKIYFNIVDVMAPYLLCIAESWTWMNILKMNRNNNGKGNATKEGEA